MRYESVDWINLPHVKDQRPTLVDTVINHWVPLNTRNFLNDKLSAFEGLYYGVSNLLDWSVHYGIIRSMINIVLVLYNRFTIIINK
jgi:hypothetical protein